MDYSRTYAEPHPDEGFLYVREWEDHRLEEEFRFILSLLHAVSGEVAFRADHPEYRDGTGSIPPSYTKLYELHDEIGKYAVQMNGAVLSDPGRNRE